MEPLHSPVRSPPLQELALHMFMSPSLLYLNASEVSEWYAERRTMQSESNLAVMSWCNYECTVVTMTSTCLFQTESGSLAVWWQMISVVDNQNKWKRKHLWREIVAVQAIALFHSAFSLSSKKQDMIWLEKSTKRCVKHMHQEKQL